MPSPTGGRLVEFGMTPGSAMRLRNLKGQIATMDAVNVKNAVVMTSKLTYEYLEEIKYAFKQRHPGTNRTVSTFRAKPEGLVGRIEMGGAAGIIMGGNPPHDIIAQGTALKWQGKDGEIVYRQMVHHPGTAPDDFILRAEMAFGGGIEAEFQKFVLKAWSHVKIIPPNAIE